MREGAKAAGFVVGLSALAIVVALIIGAMAVFGFGLFAKETANFRGSVQEAEQTKANGSFRIYSYEHFFDLCVSVQNKEKTVSVLEEELKTHPSAERVEQIYTDIAANKIAREESINQYNADVKKERTIGQFRSANLPTEINSYGKETQCE